MLHALLATIGALAVLASIVAKCVTLAVDERTDVRRPLTPRRTAASARSSCPARVRR